MKEYKEKYEKVFSNEDKNSKRCKIDQISFYQDYPMSVPHFINQFRDQMTSFEHDMFDHLVKVIWLRYRFMYKGRRRRRGVANGWDLERAHGIFMRSYVGYDLSWLAAEGNIFRYIMTYFYDMFPRFDEDNPFETPYEYPYQYAGFNHLLLVYQMDERMDLLKEAERKQMDYPHFADYVINYISCLNDELKEEKYKFVFQRKIFPTIKKCI